MFIQIRNCVKRCTPLTTGKTFFDITKEFDSLIGEYNQRLRTKLPPPIAPSTTLYSTPPPPHHLSALQNIACVVNTCDYCKEIIPQMRDLVVDKIDAQYKESVGISDREDEFDDTLAAALKALVGVILTLTDPHLKLLSSLSFSTLTGDVSEYARRIVQLLREIVPTIRSSVAPIYFNSVCTKVMNLKENGMLFDLDVA